MPPAISAVYPGGHPRQIAESDRTGPTRSRRSRPERSVYRRLLFRGQKRGPCVGKTKKGKGTKIMAIADRAGLPLALCTESASPHEVTLVEKTLDQMLIDEQPECLIGDRAYDSDQLDKRLMEQRGLELITPRSRSQTAVLDIARQKYLGSPGFAGTVLAKGPPWNTLRQYQSTACPS